MSSTKECRLIVIRGQSTFKGALVLMLQQDTGYLKDDETAVIETMVGRLGAYYIVQPLALDVANKRVHYRCKKFPQRAGV